jgi:folate-binding protein YgfZ
MNSLINQSDLGVLSVMGKDSASFLQGQMTCDVNALVDGKSQFGAFCNPKGKVIATFLIVKLQENFFLILPKTLLSTVQGVLQRYKLRSKVEFSEMENFPIERFLKPAELRTPWILPETSEQFIPHALKLDKTGAVSFTKGCYTGQEIVARTHYLGDVKRQLNLGLCEPSAIVETNCGIIDENEENVGSVLLAKVRGLARNVKDPITGEITETISVSKMIVLCVLNTETVDSTLRLDNGMRETLKIIGGGQKNE